MRRQAVFLVLLWLFVFSLPAAAQRGTIRGKVRAPSGSTLTNILVELWHSGSQTAQTVTTNDGDFYFTDLTPANYEIVISHSGYQPAVERAAFRFAKSEGRLEVVTVEITLKPLPGKTASYLPRIVFAQDVPFGARLAYEQAVKRLKANKTDEAIAKLKEAVISFPGYFQAHLLLATELSKRDQIQPALEALEKARTINDRDPRAYHLFGIIMARQQKYVVAEFAFRQAIQRDPANLQSYLSHAITLIEIAIKNPDRSQRLVQLDEAERNLKRALELSDRKLANVHLQLARVYEHRGERKAAASQLEAYLKLQPDAKNAAAIREAIAKLNQ